MKKNIILFLLFNFSIKFGQAHARDYGLCHLYYNFPTEKEVVENLNVQWARNDFLWEVVEPKKDEWNYSRYDEMVEKLRRNGKKILGILTYDTPWIHKNNKSQRKITKENISYFLNYVEKTVTRYKGKVDAWEIWNEPNNPFITKSKDEDFFELTKQTSILVKKIDPNIYLVSGSIWLADDKFLDKMFKYGALEKADAISYHPYSVSSSLLPDRIRKMKAVMNKYNFKGQVWITEFGFPTHGIYFSKKFDDRSFPAEIIKSLTYFASADVDKIFWYTLFDNFNPGEDRGKRFNSENFFGLAFPNGQLKRGGHSFSQFTKLIGSKKLDNSFLNLEHVNDKDLRVFVFRESNKGAMVIWRDGILGKKIRLNGAIRRFRSHDLVTGEISEMPNNEIKVNKLPQIFTFEILQNSRLQVESF